MTEATFAGQIRGNVFQADLPEQWYVWQSYHEGKRVVFTVDLERQHRSLAQNRRYHSQIVGAARECLNVNREIPLSKDQVHWLMKGAFIGWEDTPLGKAPKSSKVLDTAQFAAFCKEAEGWFSIHSGSFCQREARTDDDSEAGQEWTPT